jgi:hypothetical protein
VGKSRYERAAMSFLRTWADLPATFRSEFVRALEAVTVVPNGDGPELALAMALDTLNEEVDK